MRTVCNSAVNTVAPTAFAEIDVRYLTNLQRDALEIAVRAIAELDDAGTTTTLTARSGFLALVETPASRALSDAYIAAGRSLGLAFGAEFTGGCADSGFTAALGIPTICGIGPVGGKAHTADEYMEIETLSQRAAVLYDTIISLAG